MAVEIKNKRKRKHESGAADDEDASMIPKKQSKKSLTPIKVTQAAQNDGHRELGTDILDEKEIKFSKDFKMMEFRTKLRGNNFITELRHFLHLCQIRPKTIAKYIEKRGKPLEFAEALERIDKTNVLHLAYICEALQLVIMEIISNQPTHLESAVHASRYFLKSHGPLLDLLLQSAQVKHRKVALKLLTAIVCVEPQLGRQVLASYDILLNVKNIIHFLSHSPNEIQQQNEQNFETVRKCFIHFVLSFIVDGNILLIRNILDRGSLIRALAGGLLYDDAETVCMILNTLRKYVLECPEITKTKKIHVFDFDCCKTFVKLYEWMGPKVFAAKFTGKKKSTTNLNEAQLENLINPQEKEVVSKAAHEFLLILLTSRKCGIAFDTVKFFRQKHNTIQGQLMGFLRTPWNDDRKTDLVIKILEACPDLFRNTVRNFAGIINPLRTPPRYWLNAVNFLTKIINTCHPRHLKSALDKITLTDFSFWIKDICLPLESLVHINGNKFLKHSSFPIRLATNRLLLAMFQQYTNYMQVINQREQNKGTNSLRRFKFDLLNHLLMNFPTMENILISLNTSVQMKSEKGVDVLAHLDVALDLVLILCQENRSFVNKTAVILDYLELLRPLYSPDEETDFPTESSGSAKSDIKLEMKAIKTILWLFPKALEPGKERFDSVLKSFIRAFAFGTDDVSREAGTLLQKIFKNTGIFESCELEIDLWLETLKFCDAVTVDTVAQVFCEVLKVTQAEVEMPASLDNTANKESLQTLFKNIENGLSVQAYVESLNISKLMPLIYKGVVIVPSLAKYLQIVCFFMFHYFPSAENVLALYRQQFKAMLPFMQNWLDKEPTKELTNLYLQSKAGSSIPYLKDVQTLVLFGQQSFAEIFGSQSQDDVCEIEFRGNVKKFTGLVQRPRLLMIYVQLVLFEVQQLKEKHMLTQQQAEKSAEFVSDCLAMIIKFSPVEVQPAYDDNESLDNELFIHKLLKYIYGVRFQELKSNELISAYNVNDSYRNYLRFMILVTQYCNKLDKFDCYAENFKLKLVKTVAIASKDRQNFKTNSEYFEEFNNLINVFNLNKDHCGEILNLLVENLSYKDFFLNDNNNQKSLYYAVMVSILQRLAALKKTLSCPEFVQRFCKIYSKFFKKLNHDFNVELLEEAFYNFLLTNHHLVEHLDNRFFATFFQERKLTKSCIKLATLVFERVDRFNEVFVQNLEQNLDKKELMYPLIDVAFKKNLPMEQKVLQNIYQNYKNGFMRTIEKPSKAGMIYKDNVSASLKLIELCMPLTECKDFCHKQFKFEHIETYQLRTIYKIYEKAFGNSDLKQKASIFVQFVTLQVQMLSLDLKMQKLNEEKLLLFCYHLQEWFKYGWQAFNKNELAADTEDAAQLVHSPDFSKLLKTQQWLQFCKTCLKTGMHMHESDVEVDIKDDKFNGLLLKLLAFLIDNLYIDYSEESADSSANLECAQLYEMILTHSKFYNIVLTKPPQSGVKTQILHLLFVMARKAPSCLQETQIPVILGAYQAKLYDSDRYCLALLNLFDYYDCNLSKYRPFIWGESAIAFYALKQNDEERAKLSQQETSIEQVMSLVDRQLSEYTIDNFPIWRKLNTLHQLPEVQFENPFIQAWQFGANTLEQQLELNLTAINESEMRLCPKRAEIFEQCYDPAFFVPLMSMCFSPESYAHPARPVQNGLLALSFAALSSQDKEMRQAAGCVQQRYRQHFENSKFFEKPLWQQTYENIQSGLSDLRDSWMKHKSNSGTPRVPYISGLFVAKTFNLTTDPSHLLYKQLTMFLRLKSSFNFQCIPEFNVLFYSPEVEHQQFRQFIVDVIRNGIKSSSDLFLLVSTNTFKVLMGFYGSTMSTLDLNLQILSVFSTCAKIPASSKIMVDHIGILPWLSSIIASIEFYQFDVIEGLISIINNLWYAVKANEKEFHNFQHLQVEMHRLILQLLPLMSPRISLNNFAKLMNILNKTCLHSSQHLALSRAQLEKLLSCAEKHFGCLVLPLEAIFENGGAGCSSFKDFCQELYNQQVDTIAILALSSLRTYLINWWSSNNHAVKNIVDSNESLLK